MLTRRALLGLISIPALLAVSAAAQSPAERVLIRTAKPYDKVVAAIQARGGVVTHQFKYVDVIAAKVPQSAMRDIRVLPGVTRTFKDLDLKIPDRVDMTSRKAYEAVGAIHITPDGIRPLSAADIKRKAATPAAYSVNNTLMGLDPLHAAGLLGTGVIVAVIDAGVRPGFPHIAGSVIGGEDFVGDGLGYSDSSNDPHGTFVSGMIAAHAALIFENDSPLVQALLNYAPAAVFPYDATNSLVPMVGTAPEAQIYALRVFGPELRSVSTSVLMSALERTIELRDMFDAGIAGGLNIRVCNISLAGGTVDPGESPVEQLIDAMLAHDIVPAIAAGNAGPAAITVGSPATSNSALAVGAANLAHNERVSIEIGNGPGIGALFRPDSRAQVASFSSRGPNADGRVQPNVMANGVGSFGMGYGPPTMVGFGDGTSFAAPTVAGIAAVLRQAFPSATARQIRNAIIVSANPAFLNAATNLDQGGGFVNASAARDVLAAENAPDSLTPLPNANSSVKVNIERSTSLNVLDGNISRTFANLQPGERHDVVYRISPNTAQVLISVSGFAATLPPEQQNALFGDDLIVAVHSAKTSSIGYGDYLSYEFTRGGSLVINNPETGLVRVSVSGDWTNAGNVSGTISVVSLADPIPMFTFQNKIFESQQVAIPFTIPAGTKQVDVRLGWRNDWGTFPTADIDLYLISPASAVNVDGASANNPETVTITDPAPGNWLAVIDPFDVPSGSDKYELRIALDGKVIH